MQLAGEECSHAAAHAARSTAAGDGLHVDVAITLDDLGKTLHVCIKNLDHLGRGSFLGPEDMGCTGGPVERIVDIAHGGDGDALECRIQARGVDAVNLAKRASGGNEGFAGLVTEYNTACSCSTTTTIVGCTAAESDNNGLAAALGGIEDQLADTVGGSQVGVKFITDKRKSCTGRHLNDRCVFLDHPIETFHGEGVRALDGKRSLFASESLQKCVYTTFSTVGHRNAGNLGIWIVLLDCFVHDGTDLFGTHGSFEGIGD